MRVSDLNLGLLNLGFARLVLDFGANGSGSGPGRGRCVVFLGKTLYSALGASLHPGV